MAKPLAPLLRGVCPCCGDLGCVSEVCRSLRARLPVWLFLAVRNAGEPTCSRCAAPARRGLCRHCAPIVRRERRRKALQRQVGRDRDGGGAAGRYRRVSLLGLMIHVRGVASERDPLARRQRSKRARDWLGELGELGAVDLGAAELDELP